MLSLLRSECYQVRKALSVKITFAIMLATSIIFTLQVIDQSDFKESYFLYGGGMLLSSLQDGGMQCVLAGLFAGWMISGSFENRMMQEAISYGKSRAKVYMAKMLVFLVVVISSGLLYCIGGSIPAFIKNGLGTQEIVGNLCHIDYVIGMLVSGMLAYTSLFAVCGAIAFLNRKMGTTIGICIAVCLLGGNMLPGIAPNSIGKVIGYTPLGLYNQVLKLDVEWGDIWKTGCLSLVWIVVICGIGVWRFRKAELK